MDYTEYLDLAVQLIKTNERPGAPFPAAALGGVLRKAAPEVTFRTFGKRTLREVLDELQASGRITITQTDKDALAMMSAGHSPSPPKQRDTYNPLHRSMWEAFVFVAPEGRRFLNRLTGTIRVGLVTAPAPADEWVELTPIGAEVQRQWATDFTAEQDSETVRALQFWLDSEAWNAHTFVTALRDLNPQAARAWNAFRSNRVSIHVQKWLAENALPPTWAFQQQAAPVRATCMPAIEGLANDEAETRGIVLAALGQMPLSQLLTIPIPVGLVINALSKKR